MALKFFAPAFAAMVVLCSSIPAHAEKIIFDCTTTQNKIIKVLDRGGVLQYSYGRNGHPEITLNVPRVQAFHYRKFSGSRDMIGSIDIPNRDITYSVFSVVDRFEPEKTNDSGVTVLKTNAKGEKEIIAGFFCNTRLRKISNLMADIEGVPAKSE